MSASDDMHTEDRPSASDTTCGWCLGAHPTHACPRGPKLSVRSVVAFVFAAMERPARGWS
jgi:hypothetical protein